jgi:hypothetical protein
MEKIIPSNLIPFKNKALYKNNKTLKFDSIIISLPTIPKIYFKSKDTNNKGSIIIDKYYTIRKSLNELKIMKDFIISILETFKDDLESIDVSKKKYNIKKTSLNPYIKHKLVESFPYQDDFIQFISEYIETKYSLFSDNTDESPLFKQVFENEYMGTTKTKNFIIKLFAKYFNIRSSLTELINEHYGLLAFDLIFNLNDVINFQKKQKFIRIIE